LQQKRCYKSDIVALREIQKYQKIAENLILKMIFERLIKEIMHDYA